MDLTSPGKKLQFYFKQKEKLLEGLCRSCYSTNSDVISNFFSTWAYLFSLKMMCFISRKLFCVFLKCVVLLCPYFSFDHGVLLPFQNLSYPSGLILLFHFFFCLDGVSLSLWQFFFVCWLRVPSLLAACVSYRVLCTHGLMLQHYLLDTQEKVSLLPVSLVFQSNRWGLSHSPSSVITECSGSSDQACCGNLMPVLGLSVAVLIHLWSRETIFVRRKTELGPYVHPPRPYLPVLSSYFLSKGGW